MAVFLSCMHFCCVMSADFKNIFFAYLHLDVLHSTSAVARCDRLRSCSFVPNNTRLLKYVVVSR